ncbi:MAG TPA: DUF3168 domain-containing protein [Propylenella sp.]
MALLYDALYALLTADATVSGIVGTRVHPVLRAQDGDLPALVMTRVGGEHAVRHEGAASFARTRVQIDSLAATATAAQDLADAVRQALDYARGTYGGFRIDRAQVAAPPIDFFDGTSLTQRVTQDYSISHGEVTP